MPPETWTILRLLKWATAHFKTHHIDQPRSACEILLGHALGLKRVDLYVEYDRPLQPEELATFKELIKRHLRREPVAYITGEKGFWSLDLKVTPHVLIPRPETEILVEAVLSVIPVESPPRPLKILDLGTGSGAIVVALAKERPGHRFFAVDSSAEALGVAQENARRHGVGGGIAFSLGNWFEAVREDGEGFDVIVSNPPYIRREDLEVLPPEISRYEPRQALDGGPDGLDAIRVITGEGPRHLQPGGWLFMEIGFDQWAAVEGLVIGAMAYEGVSVIKDYAGLNRVVKARAKRA